MTTHNDLLDCKSLILASTIQTEWLNILVYIVDNFVDHTINLYTQGIFKLVADCRLNRQQPNINSNTKHTSREFDKGENRSTN